MRRRRRRRRRRRIFLSIGWGGGSYEAKLHSQGYTAISLAHQY
jgi:hypothetical protein